MNLILLGAPGAGKGTQAEIVCDKLNIPAISTGNILRAAVKDGTEMGLKAKSFMDAGALVPDEVIIGILKERLAQPTAPTASSWTACPHHRPGRGHRDHGHPHRQGAGAAGRGQCDRGAHERPPRLRKCGASYHIINKKSKVEGVCDLCGGKTVIRKDDQPATVLDRLKAYHEQTEPLVDFYRTRGKLAEIKFCPPLRRPLQKS